MRPVGKMRQSYIIQYERWERALFLRVAVLWGGAPAYGEVVMLCSVGLQLLQEVGARCAAVASVLRSSVVVFLDDSVRMRRVLIKRKSRVKHNFSNIDFGLLYMDTARKIPFYVFLFWELRGLSPNFHIHVSVSDLYIPRIGPHISLQQNRQTDPGNI
jgi:hypothetical protein